MNFERDLLAERYARGAGALVRLSPDADAECQKVVQKILGQTYRFLEKKCAVCDGEVFDVLAEQDRYGLPIQTVICVKCGLMQTNPDMREEDYLDFYINHYRRLYIADLVGEPVDFFREEVWRGQRILEFVEGAVRLPRNGLVLEVGCGAGGILHAFQRQGYRVIGTDLGAENLSYGREIGLDLRQGDIFNLELKEAPDLIIFSHVLEHIRNPALALRRARDLLGPGGFLYIEVPGVKYVRKNSFQGDFLKTFHLSHVYNFSLRTLRNLMVREGFECVSGDEYVRAVFVKGERSEEFESDYAEAKLYMARTERWRVVYRALFVIASEVKRVRDFFRRSLISLLRRAGLYSAIRAAVRYRR